jgi:hypothetical protein
MTDETDACTSLFALLLPVDWNESFDVEVKDSSVLAVSIFDQKKFKKKDQGFLGVINIPVAQAVDLDLGGEGALSCSLWFIAALTFFRNRDVHPRFEALERPARRSRQVDRSH